TTEIKAVAAICGAVVTIYAWGWPSCREFRYTVCAYGRGLPYLLNGCSHGTGGGARRLVTLFVALLAAIFGWRHSRRAPERAEEGHARTEPGGVGDVIHR